MPEQTGLGAAGAASTSLLEAQAAQLLERTRTAKISPAGASSRDAEEAKINKSAKDFESILMGSWLQQAEQSFASVPGGDGDEDEDPGKDQFQGIAMQALAGSMTKSGGIGIAKMIAEHLHQAANRTSPPGGSSS